MGLLDEAIREHLELRRRHGADPDEVAREELDALSPVDRERERQEIAAEKPADPPTAKAPTGLRSPFDGERAAGRATESSTSSDVAGAAREVVSFMEETAEIDMRTVLGELEDAMSDEEDGGGARVRRAECAAPVAAGGTRPSFGLDIDEDQLAWETTPQARRFGRPDGGEAARAGG